MDNFNFKYYLIGESSERRINRLIIQLNSGRGKIKIGRDKSCDHLLESIEIQKIHCSLTFYHEFGFLKNENLEASIKVNRNLVKFGQSLKIVKGDQIKLGTLRFRFYVKKEKVAIISLVKPKAPINAIIKRDIRLAELRSRGYHVDNSPFCTLPENFNRDYFSFKDMQAAYRFHPENYQATSIEERTFADYDSDD